MPAINFGRLEGLREEDDDPEIVQNTAYGKLDSNAQASHVKKQPYVRLAMKQLNMDYDEANEYLDDDENLANFIKNYGGGKSIDEMEKSLAELKKTLLGTKKKESKLISQIEEAE